MRVTKFFTGLGLAAMLGMLSLGTLSAEDRGGGRGGGGNGGGSGVRSGGSFHGGTQGRFRAGVGAAPRELGGQVGGHLKGAPSLGGKSPSLQGQPSKGFRGGPDARFLPGGTPHSGKGNLGIGNPGISPKRELGPSLRSQRTPIDRFHPVNPHAWNRNPNWWKHQDHHHDGWRFADRHHRFLPWVDNSFWSPLWWGFNPYATWYGRPYYNDYYYGYGDGGYSTTVYNTEVAVAPDETMGEVAVENQPSAAPESTGPAGDWGKQFLASAVDAFRQGQYADALRLGQHAAIEMPRDVKTHELLSLALFALGDFRGANLEAHAVLSLGSPCDWPTLFAYYGNAEIYTKQLDKLADYLRKNPEAADARFVLGFHNLMLGHKDAALKQFEKVVAKVPKDKLAIAQIKSLGGMVESKTPKPPQPVDTPKSETAGRRTKAM